MSQAALTDICGTNSLKLLRQGSYVQQFYETAFLKFFLTVINIRYFSSESFPVAGHTVLSTLLSPEFHYEINSNIENINTYQLLKLCVCRPTVCYQVRILYGPSSSELLRTPRIEVTKTEGAFLRQFMLGDPLGFKERYEVR